MKFKADRNKTIGQIHQRLRQLAQGDDTLLAEIKDIATGSRSLTVIDDDQLTVINDALGIAVLTGQPISPQVIRNKSRVTYPQMVKLTNQIKAIGFTGIDDPAFITFVKHTLPKVNLSFIGSDITKLSRRAVSQIIAGIEAWKGCKIAIPENVRNTHAQMP